MSFIRAQKYLEKKDLKDRIIVLNDFSGTVIDAAKALKTKPGNIVKTMALSVFDKPILILLSGDYKLSNSKFKEEFGCKPKMIDTQELDKVIGHEKGGICPFGINEDITVYFDESLKKYDLLYPACGTDNSAVKLTLSDLNSLNINKKWIDVGIIIE